MTHWTETAIAKALEGSFYLIDGTDKNKVDAQLAAERQADKMRQRQEVAAQHTVRQRIAEHKGITADAIILAVAHAHGVPPADLVGKSRSKHIITARHHACALMRELTGMPFTAIAAAVGIVDHSTAHHAVKTWAQRGHVYAIEDKRAREMLGVTL